MKQNKKKVFVAAVAISLIAILSFGTLAWFNASDTITNEFYVADSNEDGKPDFSIDVYEQEVDENGDPVFDEDGNPVYVGSDGTGDSKEGNTYKDILPGSELPKTVYVENTGDYDQWVRVNITISDSAVWQQAIQKAADAEGRGFDNYVLNVLFGGLDLNFYETTYVRSFNIFGEDTMTYTLYYKYHLTAGEVIQVMDSVNIPGILTQEDMNFGTGEDAGFTVSIMSEAVQVENLKADCASAAFAEVGWEVGTNYGE